MSRWRTTFPWRTLAPALAGALAWLLAGSAGSAGELFGPDVAVDRCDGDGRFALVLHGGAVWGRYAHPSKSKVLEAALAEGGALLAAGATSLDVVEGAVRIMEDSGAFNAGRGAIANRAGEIELDASIMDGRDRQAGAVAAVKRVKNPIAAARTVMEDSPHVLFVGPGADAFVSANGGAMVEPAYFVKSGANFDDVPLPADLEVVPPGPEVPPDQAAYSGTWGGLWDGWMTTLLAVEAITPEGARIVYARGPQEDWGFEQSYWTRGPAIFVNGALRFDFVEADAAIIYRLLPDGQLEAAFRTAAGVIGKATLRRQVADKGGTVGAVARDRCGDLAAGTSTGGYGSKPPGRVGDSPIIGAGTFANNDTVAVSATGHGEYFMRFLVGHEIAALMAHGGLDLAGAAHKVVMETLVAQGGEGGVIAVDRNGNIAMPYNTDGMLRGAVSHERPPEVKIYQ